MLIASVWDRAARQKTRTPWLVAILVASLGGPDVCVRGENEIPIATLNHPEKVDFEREVLPILRRNCLACHNSTNAESDLILETPESIRQGGAEGPAATPELGDKSLLIRLAAHRQEPFMPPPDNDVEAKTMTPEELGLLSLWIRQGATGGTDRGKSLTFERVPDVVNPILAAAMSPDGQHIAAGRANRIFMYHLPTRRQVGQLTDPALVDGKLYQQPGVAHLDLVQSLAFNPNRHMIASGGYRTVKLWQRSAIEAPTKLIQLEDNLTALASTPDGERHVVGDIRGNIFVFDRASSEPAVHLTGHMSAISALAISPDAAHLVSASSDGSIRCWNLAGSSPLIGSAIAPSPVTSLAVLSDGSRFVGCGTGNTIHVWSFPKNGVAGAESQQVAELQMETPLEGHTSDITGVRALPGDTSTVVSASGDGTWSAWDLSSGKRIRHVDHGARLVAVAVSPDGKRVATSASDGTTKLWDAGSGKEVASLRGDFRAQLAMGRAQRQLALASRAREDAKKELEDAKKRHADEVKNAETARKQESESETEFKNVEAAAEKAVAARTATEKMKTEAESSIRRAEARIKATPAAVKQLAQAAVDLQSALKVIAQSKLDESDPETTEPLRQVAAGAAQAKASLEKAAQEAAADIKSAQAKIKELDAQLKKQQEAATKAADNQTAALRALQAAQRTVKRAEQSVQRAAEEIPDYQQAVQNAEDSVAASTQALAAAESTWKGSQRPQTVLAFSHDSNLLATTGQGLGVALWDGQTGVALDVVNGPENSWRLLSFAGDHQLVGSSGNHTVLRQSVSRPWKLLRIIGSLDSPDLADRVTALAFSPDGKMLATGSGEPSRNGQLRIWNVDSGELIRDIPEAHSDTVLSLDFSPDGKYLAASAADRFLKVFDVQSGEKVRSFEGHTGHVMGVSWRADGRVLASGGADKVVKIWNFRTGDQQRTIDGFAKQVTAVHFTISSDGKNISDLVASCGDRIVHTKNTDNGKSGPKLTGAKDFVYCVDTSADGTKVIAGGQDSVLRVWERDGKLLHEFTPAESQ